MHCTCLPVQDVKMRSVSLRRIQIVALWAVSFLRGFLEDSLRKIPSSVPSAWQNFEYLPKDWRYFPKFTQKHLMISNSTSPEFIAYKPNVNYIM